jgi:hypothetical protein
MYARLFALLLASAPLAAAAQDEEEIYPVAPAPPRLYLTAWGGALVDTGGQFPAAGFGGAEVAWAFDALDVGVLAQGYRLGDRARTPWTPVILGRILQRFETRRGLEATLGIGIGAGRTDHWIGWFQFAVACGSTKGRSSSRASSGSSSSTCSGSRLVSARVSSL